MAEKRFLLVYGSQTGQAQAISEEIRDRAVQKGLRPELHCLSQSEKKFHLEKEPVFVVVVSTTGDGDAPDTANKFWRRLKKRTLAPDYLASCHYALLGLGDTNYSNFCNMGKMLNKRLLALGASQFYPPGFADDAVGLDIVVEPWIDGLWEALESILSSSSSGNLTVVDVDHEPSYRVHRSCSSMNTNVSGDDRTIRKKVVVDTSVETETANSAVAVQNGRITGKMVMESADGPDGVVETEDKTDATCVQEIQHEPSTRQAQLSVLDSSTQVQRTSTAVSKLATSFEDQLNVSPLTSKNVSGTLSLNGSESSTAQVSGIEVHARAAAVSETITDGVAGRRYMYKKEDSSVIDEFTRPSVELASVPLVLPSVQPPFIEVLPTTAFADSAVEFPFNRVQYAVKTSVSMATLVGSRLLTGEGSLKKTLELEFNIEGCLPVVNYQPGDAFGFVCPNPPLEVEWLLNRLRLLSERDKVVTLSILSDTTKRNPILPKHIPNPCSIEQYFTNCADIRCVPKKAFLCYLSTCCSSSVEKRRLEELSSRQGAKEYSQFFMEQRNDFLDVLSAFPSCQPQLPRLIELLPRLQPRHYSAASSPLVHPGRLKIAFNVEELPSRLWLKEERFGVATGWFNNVAVPRLNSALPVQVPIFPRVLNPFRLPDDRSIPIVMIGPGTGVSPFIGFLEHRQQQQQQHQLTDSLAGKEVCGVGKAWLFFGCRHPDKDYLYRTELEGFMKSGVLTYLHVSFSRYQANDKDLKLPRYVQDSMRLHWEELAKWIMEEEASVFVCGDAKNMATDINNALIEVLSRYLQVNRASSTETAESVLQTLKENYKYLVDAWG